MAYTNSSDITNLAKQYNLPNSTIKSIQEKASSGTAMQTPTKEKQEVYDAYQQYYKNLITQKAQTGQQLQDPNEWKNQIYNQAVSAPNGNLVSIDEYMAQAQSNSDTRMGSLQDWLEQSAKSQIDSQQAQLEQARNQALAELDMALKKAINEGELSIKEAEKQYESAKEQIYQQAYNDAELTNLTSYDRGIQNSAQMVGLMQGDQARRNSLLNQNLTTRDEQINAINNQLKQMEYETGVNKALANSQYATGLASATGEINAQLYNNLANMSFEEYQRLANNEFGLTQAQLAQQMQLEQLARQQAYAQTNARMQQDFDLEKLSVQQRYGLEQMAKQFGYDLRKMDKQQQLQLAQMAQSFGYDMALQQNQQSFQKSYLAMQQSHDFAMLNEEQRLELEQYAIELDRELSSYEEGSPEYKLREYQFNDAVRQMQTETMLQLTSELKLSGLASLLENQPVMPSDLTDKEAVEQYNKQVEVFNKQVENYTKTGEYQFALDMLESQPKEYSAFEQFIGKKAAKISGSFLSEIIKSQRTP